MSAPTVLEVLAAHRFDASWGQPMHACSCGGWRTTLTRVREAQGEHDVHVAEMLERAA